MHDLTAFWEHISLDFQGKTTIFSPTYLFGTASALPLGVENSDEDFIMTDMEIEPGTTNAKQAAPGLNATTEPNMATLVSGIIQDAHTLVRQQAEMLKAEVKEDLRRSKRAAELGSLGIVMLTVGFLALVNTLAHLLHTYTGLELWASWGVIAGLFLICGGILAWVSYSLLERFNPLPDKTYQALQETIQWNTKTPR